MSDNKVVAKKSLADYLTAPMVKQQISNVIGKTNSQRFISSIISAVQTNPQLQNCTQKSILNSALLGETLGLSPSPQLGAYYMVPYNNKGTMEATFQLGYKGYIQMAVRSGEYKKITVLPIKEGEFKSWNALEEEIDVELMTDEVARSKAKTVGYYAMFLMNNGFKKAIYWTYDKMLEHANKYSKGFAAKKGYTFWEKDFDSMAQKTLLRQLISKWGVLSLEMERAFKADMAVVSDIKDAKSDFDVDYVDNPVDQITGEVIDATPVIKAVPEQLAIIKDAISAEDMPKLLEHYQVANLEDLTVQQASEICTSLQSKKNS